MTAWCWFVVWLTGCALAYSVGRAHGRISERRHEHLDIADEATSGKRPMLRVVK